MKTCNRFHRIKAGFERDIRYLSNYAERHRGSASAKTSAKNAFTVRRNMAKALIRHFERCPECG